MRVLVAHNEYGKRSGEEAVADGMVQVFKELGCEVERLRMSTASVRDTFSGKMRTFVSGFYCPSGVRAMRMAMERFKPDVVNVHNLYPFISPAALRECKRAGAKVVMTVHNYRLMCPTGLFLRDGAPCELCLQNGNEWGCVLHNCEGSVLKSVAYAGRNAVARIGRHYLDCVDLFACLTDFQRRKLVEAGVPEERTMVIPNTVVSESVTVKPIPDGGYVGYVGRLSREKGMDLIIEAARRNPDIRFKLAGSVADDDLVVGLPSNMELVGFVSGTKLDEFFDGARFMVMASRWYEGFPMAILEAGAHGRCVVCPAHGGFVDVISQGSGDECVGELFTPCDADALSDALRRVWDDRSLCEDLGRRARAVVEKKYSPDAVREMWGTAIR